MVLGTEITLSPRTGSGMLREGAGFAIRFPRFTGRWRDDKAPEDATTVKELTEISKLQEKKAKVAPP